MSDVTFEIVEKFGVLSEGKDGWLKELNLVSWNGRDPKLDLRNWAADHRKMGRGATFNRDEASILAELLPRVLSKESLAA